MKIGFGAACLSGRGAGYGFGEIDKPEHLVRTAIDAGIEYFDTAPIYGFGHSELILGTSLKGLREKVKIVSKGGITWHSSKRVNLTNDPKVIDSMLHDSLKRLNTDYLDVYLIHWPDPRVDIRYSLEPLMKALETRKIKQIGLSNTNAQELCLAQEVAPITVIQDECNLFQNKFSQYKTDSFFKMGWGTFDKGILTGSVTLDRVFSKEDARSWAPWWKKSNWKEKVKALSKYNSDELFNISLHYSLLHTDISLCGFKSPKQLQRILNGLEAKIDPQKIQDIVDDIRSKF